VQVSVSPAVRQLLGHLKSLREAKGWTSNQMDERLMVGPGWTEVVESGSTEPSLDLVLAMVEVLGASPAEFLGSFQPDGNANVPRQVEAAGDGSDLLLRFPYADFDAEVRLVNADMDGFWS